MLLDQCQDIESRTFILIALSLRGQSSNCYSPTMPNKLSKETSPYLLQHAENPVDWFAWNEDSLQLAFQKNKPILLSIGYSACHWCHVMAHESFEDKATATLMNDLFINIKVDREERPDIDKVYQTAHQLMARAPGGWPLTVFLTPNQLPIFTGTYFPRELFKQILERVETYYQSNAINIKKQGQELQKALQRLDQTEKSSKLTLEPLKEARRKLESIFDDKYGGFGSAPKFPHPTHINSLLAAWEKSAKKEPPDLQSLFMASLTLKRMGEGGLYDHLKGGFFRYSVDQHWSIPHFEKMLYDNATLLSSYSDAHAATDEILFKQIAIETADWIIDDMQDEKGGYYSAIDADSEGEEGKYYVWTQNQVKDVLNEDEHLIASKYFGLTNQPNFEQKTWHLQKSIPLQEIKTSLPKNQINKKLESGKAKLLSAREQRIAPQKDKKILVSWNGLTIKAMARAARNLDRPDLAQSATDAVDFIRSRLWKNGRLLAVYKDGKARFPAYLDDYAFLAAGLIELLQYRWRSEDLALTYSLMKVVLEQFEDADGGFFFTSHDHENLIHRPKQLADEAMPSGNGISAQNFIILGHLLGDLDFIAAAKRALEASSSALKTYPEAHGSMLEALQSLVHPPELIIIRGTQGHKLNKWKQYVSTGYQPRRKSFAISSEETNLPEFLAQRKPRGEIVAYICQGTNCKAPITDFNQFTAALNK
ncbi:MAG: thioredoxin domain-containing protein [Rhodospirillaceae bacterium]|nr:thioredoxin domain-containing protein [Rhodospirillaceae bacterium]